MLSGSNKGKDNVLDSSEENRTDIGVLYEPIWEVGPVTDRTSTNNTATKMPLIDIN